MFAGRHIISTREFSKDEIDHILKVAERLEPYALGKEKARLLAGRLFAMLFFEPSTRTRLSFEAAAKRLGAGTIGFSSTESTSAAKGESLADTVRVLSGYADALIIRHPREGAARFAARHSRVPVINAGDGAGHHPTQTLLDLYTLRKECGLEGVRIALVGDLKYGRTVHSLAYALALYEAEMFMVSPPQLRMPGHIITDLVQMGVHVHESQSLQEVMGEVDAIYLTRIQRERFPDPTEYQRVAGSYRLTASMLQHASPRTIVMHPLPRVDEIAPDVDSTPHARYFEQSSYGVPVRMALLCLLTGVIE